MHEYNVALWLAPPELVNVAYRTDYVRAPDPFQAVLALMYSHGLTEVAYAAAHLCGTADIDRYHKVVLYVDDEGNLKGDCL